MEKYISRKTIFCFFFLPIYILFSACSFQNEDKQLNQLIENWGSMSTDYQTISNLDSFIQDFEQYKDSDEYNVDIMINQNYTVIVEEIEASLHQLSQVDNQKDFYDCYINTSKLLMKLVNEDNSISKKTIIYTIFIFIAIFVFAILVSFFLFIFLSKYDKLQNESREIGYYSDFMFQGIQNERRRISRELHDSVCQDLRAVKLETELMNINEEENQKIKETIISMLSKSIEDLRSLCNTLSPLASKDDKHTSVWQSFISSLENLIENKSQKTGIVFNVRIDPLIDAGNLNLYKSGNIFRIIQEAFSNIEKHSKAKNASVLIRNNESHGKKTILFFIIDDGVGMKTTFSKEDGNHLNWTGAGVAAKIYAASGFHFGLKNMAQRASELGADFSIMSEIDDGTKIRLEVPIE